MSARPDQRGEAAGAADPACRLAPAAPPGPDLATAGLLPALPAAFLAGAHQDLLAPLRFLPPGELPHGDPPRVDRRALAAALATANASYGHPAAAQLAGKLADPATRVVVTGQQPGLFGGPLYALTKAVAAVRLAAELERRGVAAVAVFWVATEDHDYAESARAAFLTPQGPHSFDLGADPSPLLPLGMRALGPRVASLLGELAAVLPGERQAGWLAELAGWYHPEARFGEAFSRLLARLLGARCPLLLDAMLPAVKAAEASHLVRLVHRRRELADAYESADRRLLARGFSLRVHPQPGASPLFLLHGSERRRIRWCAPDRFSLRGAADCDHEVAELIAAIGEDPARVSPGVLARPALQDAILGTFAQILGPGELSYLPQAAPAYAALEAAPPWVALRPQVVVLEEHQLARAAELGLGVADLVAPDLDLDRALARRAGGDFVAPTAARVLALLDELGPPARALDPTLEKPWEKTREQVARALDSFGGKVAGALARRDEVARHRALGLRQACRPLGGPQERVIATAHFPGRHGDAFAAALFAQLALDPRRLQVIRL